jgi:AbrB family looped-hinge helix DNA binding protein
MFQSRKITKQGQVTIPVDIRKELELEPSDEVAFIKEKGRVYIKPARNFLDMKGRFKTDKKYSDKEIDKLRKKYFAKKYKESLSN